MENKPNCTVLVVDDDENIIRFLVELLQGNVTMSFANNGEKAIDMALSQKPDLILLDVMMPGMDGFEVCKKLKGNPETESIPIVFLTGKNDDHDINEGLKLGAIDYITKPFNPERVIIKIQNHLKLIAELKQAATEKVIEKEVIIQREPFVERRKNPQRSNNNALYALVGILAVTMVGLFYYLGAHSGNSPVITNKPAPSAPITVTGQKSTVREWIKIDVTVTCEDGHTVFKIANMGKRWEDQAAIRIYDIESELVIAQRSVKLAKNQTMNYKISNSKIGGSGAGLWVKPNWFERNFAYDAIGKCG